MAMVIDGKEMAKKVEQDLLPRIAALGHRGIVPGLSVVLIGEDPASKVYVRNKERAAQRLGFSGGVIRMPADTTQEQLLAQVQALNEDPKVHGILVQLPLPAHLDEGEILREISPDKDVDGFHAVNVGRLSQGEDGFVPCTPQGVMRMLDEAGVEIQGKEAVVVGRSNIVGKPMAMLLLGRSATVTIAHSRTKDLAQVTRRADILVAAVGRANFITGDMIKPGAAVMDVGINRIGEKKLVGDVDFASAESVAGVITPVPGGVGAMTIAMLMENTVLAAERYGC